MKNQKLGAVLLARIAAMIGGLHLLFEHWTHQPWHCYLNSEDPWHCWLRQVCQERRHSQCHTPFPPSPGSAIVTTEYYYGVCPIDCRQPPRQSMLPRRTPRRLHLLEQSIWQFGAPAVIWPCGCIKYFTIYSGPRLSSELTHYCLAVNINININNTYEYYWYYYYSVLETQMQGCSWTPDAFQLGDPSNRISGRDDRDRASASDKQRKNKIKIIITLIIIHSGGLSDRSGVGVSISRGYPNTAGQPAHVGCWRRTKWLASNHSARTSSLSVLSSNLPRGQKDNTKIIPRLGVAHHSWASRHPAYYKVWARDKPGRSPATVRRVQKRGTKQT